MTGPRSSAVVLAAEAYLHKWLRTYESCVDLFLAPSEFVRRKVDRELGLPGGTHRSAAAFPGSAGDEQLVGR